MEIPEGRLTNDWLGSYLALTSTHEAHEQYHLWAGLTLLAGALRRRVYLDMEHGRIYPNLYVIFVGPSAETRKSAAMDYAVKLYIDALPNARIARDSMTAQGLIKQLNRPAQVVRDGKIIDVKQSDVFVHADEIANLFGYDKARASTTVILFTRTYTCPDVYDHTTVRDSQVRLFNLYPTILGGTDPRNLKVFPDDAVAGLTGRLIWIIQTDKRSAKSGWKKPGSRADLERRLLREMLIRDLKHISNLEGEFTATQRAQDIYDHWYKVQLPARAKDDPAGRAFLHRCHTTALQIAQLLCVSENDKLVIGERAMRAAITLIEGQLPETQRVSALSGTSDFEQLRAKLMLAISNNGGVIRRKQAIALLGRDVQTCETLFQTLVHDGTLILPPIQVGKDVFLKITQEGLSKYRINGTASQEAP